MAELAPNQIAIDVTTNENYKILQGIFEKMMSPEAKADFEPVFKKHVNPNYVTDSERAKPHVDPLLKRLEAIDKKLEGLDNDKIDAEFAKKFARLKELYGVTDDGLETIKKFMVERRIADPEDAWFAWKGREPAAPSLPSGMQPSSWGFDAQDNEDSKAIWSDGPDYDKYLAKIWNEAAQGR